MAVCLACPCLWHASFKHSTNLKIQRAGQDTSCEQVPPLSPFRNPPYVTIKGNTTASHNDKADNATIAYHALGCLFATYLTTLCGVSLWLQRHPPLPPIQALCAAGICFIACDRCL